MATRIKTVEYAFNTVKTAVLSASNCVFDPLMVAIPETGSRTFKSCFVEYFTMDSASAAVNSTGSAMMWRLDTNTYITSSPSFIITNTGEHMSWVAVNDVTKEFVEHYTSSMTGSIFNLQTRTLRRDLGTGTTNSSAKLTCTYEYDDAANTRIKTICIPMESTNSALVSTNKFILDRIPALDTYLPEANKVYRNIFIEMKGNDGQTAASPISSASFFLDNSASFDTTGIFSGTLASGRFLYYIVNLNGIIDTSVTHSFYMRTSNGNMPFPSISPLLVVTYEYDHAASDQVMNYIMVPAADEAGFMQGPTSASRGRYVREISVQEPQITMSNCGIYHSYADSAALTFRPTVSSSGFRQNERTFTITAPAGNCGGFMLSHRFDSESVQGQGLNLQRGVNMLTSDWYRTAVVLDSSATSRGSFYSAVAILNYKSGKSSRPGGDANHAQVRKKLLFPFSSSAFVREVTSSINVPESGSYWLTSFGSWLYSLNSAPGNVVFLTQVTASNEGDNGIGWNDLFSGLYNSDSEIGLNVSVIRMRDSFRRFPNEPDTKRLIPTLNRVYATHVNPVYHTAGYMFYTYHTIDYDLTGSISGYTGDGSGITVDFFRSDNNALAVSTTSSIGGSFSAKWYDNTIPLYAVARQDDTHLGRSANSTASGAP